jgi:superfamily II DNA or RNA helicase
MERDFPNLEFRTYQSFVNLSEEEIASIPCDLLILDEFHHIGAPVWGARINTMIETHPNMKIFGMTAYTVRDRGTSYERDMTNPDTDELFSNKIVSRYDLCDAMIDGVLPKPIYRSAYIKLLDLEEELEKRVQKLNQSSEEYKNLMELLNSAKKRIQEAPSIPEESR